MSATTIPESRFRADGFYHPDLNYPNSINATGGYFLEEDIRAFDNSFFGINSLEAKYMDPQQRKLLEVVYECCENSGLSLEKLSGSNTGCYVANFTSDFQILQAKDPDTFHRYSATGMGLTILANRVSYVFDLRGPSMVLDTACSSSLYSLHTACSALISRECDGAFVAGANLIQSPEVHIAAVKTGVLSGTSECHTFDESADGYGRAEGVGAIFLKRLSDATRDGDPIRSVIRGTAANSNGKTNGINLPSAYGQEAVIRKAYRRAGLGLDRTDYIEAHGTGTPVGDPIEVEALSRVFHHRSGRKTLVGSIKPNIGHSEAVSGISSVIKVTMSLEHRLIPPTIGIKRVNPELKLDERGIEIATELTSWPEGSARRASINSFGYGGANAHVILEAADDPVLFPLCADSSRIWIVPLSAHNQSSLLRLAEDLMSSNIENDRVEDLAFTLCVRRSHLAVRGFFLVKPSTMSCDIHPSKLQLLKTLDEHPVLPLAFVFTGQGAQWASMGSLLIERFPTFHHTIQELDSCLAGLPIPPSWTITEIIQEPEASSMIHTAAYSQPACTAIQIALISLLREWGTHTQCVIGHSSGEIAAAFAAEHITAREAILIAYYRGQIMLKSSPKGAMIAVGLESNSVTKMIHDNRLQGKLSIACVNSPENTTVSGDEEAVDLLATYCQDRNIFARKLKTDGRAYHSRHMLTIGQEYEDLVSGIFSETLIRQVKSTPVRMISSVTGESIQPSQTRTAAYWRKNLESTVLFYSAIHTLCFDKRYHVIEVGPHPALKLPIAQTWKSMDIKENDCLYSPTLSRRSDSVADLLQLAGSLFLRRYAIDIDKINCSYKASSDTSTAARRQTLHNLPNIKWNHGSVLWHESRRSREFRNREHTRHELLGTRVPGDNGKTRTWRNVLKVKDVPWLGDHKLGQTVVFPAAGYLAAAVEAFRQVIGPYRCSDRILAFRQVNFLKALGLLDDIHGVEILTELRPQQISGTTASEVWWQFEMSSHAGQTSTVHANGCIGLDTLSQTISPALRFSTTSMEWQSMRNWYRKMQNCNINLGSSFHSLSEIMADRMRKERQTMAKTILGPNLSCSGPHSRYVIHPTAIDALLQTGWIASTAGSIEDLTGLVPVSIGSIRMAMPSTLRIPEPATIRGVSEPIGLQSVKFSSELYDSEGTVRLQMQEGRSTPYQEGATRDETPRERYPMLRVFWKPDLSLLISDNAFNLWKCNFKLPPLLQTKFSTSETRVMALTLDLLAHKDPNLNILMLEAIGSEVSSEFPELLHAKSSLRRFQSFSQDSMTDSGLLLSQAHTDHPQMSIYGAATEPGTLFDVICIPFVSGTELYLKNHFEKLVSNLADSGSLIYVDSPKVTPKLAPMALSRTVIPVPDSDNKVVILTKTPSLGVPMTTQTPVNVVLVGRIEDNSFNSSLEARISSTLGFTVTRLALSDLSEINLPTKSIVVSTIELREPIVASLNAIDLQCLKTLVKTAAIILWISGGNLYQAERPDFAPILGLARSVMLELPSVKFIVLDVNPTQEELGAAESNVLTLLQRAKHDFTMDLEYLQHEGILHISRFVPDQRMARRFHETQDKAVFGIPLKDAGTFQLSIKQVGQMDSVHFVTNRIHDSPLDPDFIEVEARVRSLNAKDVHVIFGRIDTKNATCSIDMAGIVKRVGYAVTSFSPGDRVVVMAPGHFGNVERVPEWACCKLRDDEDLAIMATIPLVTATALYALSHRAQLEKGESILIHSAASGVGIAAVQIAKLRGAKIYATVSSTEKKSFLMKTFGLEENHILSSRDSSFLPAVMQATSGRGVDVVLNFLTGDLLHDSWRCCAEFGRFVEIGKRDIVDAGRLDMDNFTRGVTFTAFDLTSLYHSTNPKGPLIWHELLQESVRLYRENIVQMIPPPKVYDISEVVQAFRAVSLSSRIGKIAVSFENPDSLVSVIRPRYETRLDTNKSYFLVGCLGGLGRSLSKWMFGQGARRFVFFGRSGTEKQEAKNLVQDLRNNGADVSVVYGDVAKFADVEQAIAQIPKPIGGVVHAAMGLDEALFGAMTEAKWRKCIDPKIKGAWNIHNALRGKEDNLDFLLLTSSISGSVGTATESNYCSANAFLDAFARYRRSLGLRAISIGLGMISEVGYLHEHPEIEALLLRKGLHPITESELLQMVDIALTEDSRGDEPYGSSHFMEGHILTGLEAQSLQSIRDQGFEGGSHVLDDPRTLIMARSLAQDDKGDATNAVGSAHGTHSLPKPVADALATEGTPINTLTGALDSFLAEKFRNLLLLPKDQLSAETPFSQFGLDSMLAAEVRQFIYRVFDVDVSFMMLLAKTTTVATLSKMIAGSLLEARTAGKQRS
ncbi:reducing type I polyketide synthase 10 [Usnea florida]